MNKDISDLSDSVPKIFDRESRLKFVGPDMKNPSEDSDELLLLLAASSILSISSSCNSNSNSDAMFSSTLPVSINNLTICVCPCVAETRVVVKSSKNIGR